MPGAILKFQPNTPTTIRLKYAAGTEKAGDYGTQYMHSLLPTGITYLQPVVENQIQKLGIKDGESVIICKRVDGANKTTWLVERPEVATPTAPVNAQAVSQSTQVQPNATTAVTQAGGTSISKIMARCWISAIDAVSVARDYAIAKQLPFQFSEEDIRCSANAIFIQVFKSGLVSAELPNPEQTRVNGGTQWQH